jgi:hypothetical protein
VNVQLPPEQADSSGSQQTMTRIQVKAQKIRLIKLLLSFAIATKHHLRGEYETDYEDFMDVLPNDLFGKRRNTLSGSCQAWSAATSTILSQTPRESSPLLGDPRSTSYHAYEDEKKYAFPLMSGFDKCISDISFSRAYKAFYTRSHAA